MDTMYILYTYIMCKFYTHIPNVQTATAEETRHRHKRWEGTLRASPMCSVSFWDPGKPGPSPSFREGVVRGHLGREYWNQARRRKATKRSRTYEGGSGGKIPTVFHHTLSVFPAYLILPRAKLPDPSSRRRGNAPVAGRSGPALGFRWLLSGHLADGKGAGQLLFRESLSSRARADGEEHGAAWGLRGSCPPARGAKDRRKAAPMAWESEAAVFSVLERSGSGTALRVAPSNAHAALRRVHVSTPRGCRDW